MIRANIETEIAPIVGSEKQAEDLVAYIKKESEGPQGVWGTNIFGKSIEDLVMDGMRNKITLINEESQVNCRFYAEDRKRQQWWSGLHYYIVIVSFFFTGKYDKINSK